MGIIKRKIRCLVRIRWKKYKKSPKKDMSRKLLHTVLKFKNFILLLLFCFFATFLILCLWHPYCIFTKKNWGILALFTNYEGKRWQNREIFKLRISWPNIAVSQKMSRVTCLWDLKNLLYTEKKSHAYVPLKYSMISGRRRAWWA